jgi:hypothetical protein
MIMNPHYTNIHVARSDQGNVEYQSFTTKFNIDRWKLCEKTETVENLSQN